MSMRIYSGEYLVSPYALHFGLNWCTHGCWYCFANANKPNRAAEQSDIAKIIRWHDVGSDCAEFRLLKAGHPILVSNDSDPCSKSSRATFGILHATAKRYGFRLVYQTRGGEPDAEDEIINGTPTSVYVSLTTDNEELGKKMEPGAPPHSQRMAFIKRLKQAGHHVIIGMNPHVPAWWVDVRGCIARLADYGVKHVWHQPLHISRFQKAAFRGSAKRDFADWIDYGMKKVEPEQERYAEMLSACHSAGINTIRGGVGDELGFWDAYFAMGFPFVPTMDALVRDSQAMADAAGKAYAMFGVEAFTEWADFGMKDGAKCKEYLAGFGRSVRNAGERVEDAKSMRGVHSFMWRKEEYPTRFRHSAFARVSYGGGWASDENGVPLTAVCADGFAEEWAEVEPGDCLHITSIRRLNYG